MSEFSPVLIVVDTQNGFVTDGSKDVVPEITSLVKRWLQAGGAVIFTRYLNYSGSPFERLVGWYGLHEAQETAIVDSLVPLTKDPRAKVIDKRTYTAFTSEFNSILNNSGYTDLFICGIATDGCVLKTALDAFDSGYTPWVISDAVASNATSVSPQEVHRTALLLLTRLIGIRQVIHAEDALAKLLAPSEGLEGSQINSPCARALRADIEARQEAARVADRHLRIPWTGHDVRLAHAVE